MDFNEFMAINKTQRWGRGPSKWVTFYTGLQLNTPTVVDSGEQKFKNILTALRREAKKENKNNRVLSVTQDNLNYVCLVNVTPANNQ